MAILQSGLDETELQINLSSCLATLRESDFTAAVEKGRAMTME